MAWERFGEGFSSCNSANYKQGNAEAELHWCGKCPKCANTYLLFAPFISAYNLQALFGGQDLFQDPDLTTTFKGLLGVDGVMKPLECVAEVSELRKAYNMISFGEGYAPLPFTVPNSSFDYKSQHDYQVWAYELIEKALPKS
jgi:hypothetical protein